MPTVGLVDNEKSHFFFNENFLESITYEFNTNLDQLLNHSIVTLHKKS